MARIRVSMAEQAVLDGKTPAGADAETRDGASRIRAALEAVERGDDAKATECLCGISRSSPFAD